jgi:phosphonate metabolism protein PhnN/1,5-bisphosphokinase (PRPP-forming)
MIFAVVGPSGAGKDTLIRGALATRPDLRLVRRVITRPTEAGGEDFEGVSAQEFLLRRERGEFALHWEAHGLSYGIPKVQLDGAGDVLFNGSRAALPLALEAFPHLRVIMVTAPNAILAQRLALRGREDPADIEARLKRASFTLPSQIVAETVINDSTTDVGIARFLAALQPVKA